MMNSFMASPARVLFHLFWLTALTLSLNWVIYYSLEQSLKVPLFHIDGAYQTASALYRLSEGQLPGRDFQPYLGVAVSYLLLPAYWMAGKTIAASQFSAFIMTAIVGIFAIAIVWKFVFRSRSFWTAILAGGVIYSLTIAIAQALEVKLPMEIAFAFEPGNSLRPLRAAAPYFTIAIFYVVSTRFTIIWLKVILYALLTGAVLLWSNDFAIPTAFMLGLLIFFHAIHAGYFTWQRAIVYFLFSVVVWLLLLMLSTAGHGFSFISYNFLDVAKDQWWFFGPYEAETRIFSIRDLYKLFGLKLIYSSLFLILIIFRAIWLRQLEGLLLAWLGCVLFLGGTLASVGGHIGGYHSAFIFWAMITAIILLLNWVWVNILLRIALLHNNLMCIVVRTFCLGFLASAVLWQKNYFENAKHLYEADTSLIYVSQLGGYLPDEFRDYIDFALKQDNTQVVEEYWGILSAAGRHFSNWPVDSVIHALGRTRNLAIQKMDNADIITTTRYRLSPIWQPWNLSQNYWFYDKLFREWDIVGQFPTNLIWRKLSKPREFIVVPCEVDPVARVIRLNVLRSGFYRVELDYDLATENRRLLMLQNNISFAPDAKGYVSVEPTGRTVIFPVYIPSPNENELHAKVVNGRLEELSVRSCKASAIPEISSEVLHIPSA